MAKQFIPIIDDERDLTPPAGAEGNQDRGFTPIVDEDDAAPRPEGVPPEATETEPGKWEWKIGGGDGPPNLPGPGGKPAGPQVFIDKARYKGAEGQPSDMPGQAFGDKVVRGATRGVIEAAKQTSKLAADLVYGEEGTQAVDEFYGDTGKPQSITEGITGSVTQFTVGVIGAGKLLKGAKVLQGTGAAVTVGRATVTGAMADATVFDPLEGRLSNLVEEVPSLHNPITDYLAAAPDDTQAEGRLKNALEGAVIGNALEGLMAAVRGVKRVRLTRAAKGDEAAAKELEKALDEVEAVAEPKPAEAPANGPATGTEAPKAPEATQGTPKPSDGLEASAQPGQKQVLDQAEVDDVIKSLKDDYDPESVSGLWNQSKIDAEGGVRQALESTAKKVLDQVNAKTGGVQTWKETAAKSAEMADAFGQKPEEFMVNLSRLAKGTEEQAALVFTARRMQNGIAKEIQAEARKLDSGLSTDKTAINAAIQKLAELESYLAPIRTAQARGTRQWGMVADDMMSQQNIRAIIAGADPAKLLRPKSWSAKAMDFMSEYRINAMLSGPKTHLVNMLSNTAMMAIRPAERMLGGDVRGGLAEYMGMMTGAWDSIQMASKSLMLEESVLDPMVLKQEVARFGTSAKALGANPNSTFGQALDWMGKAIRMPTRFLVAEDEFFKQMNYRASVYATATREAAEKGLPADKIGAYVAQRIDEFYESGGKAIDPDALREARVASFQEDLSGFAQRTASFLNSHPFTRFIAPFVKTPINIMKQAAIRTPPVAWFMDSFQNELKAGGSRAARARGQLAMGGMLWGGALGLAFSGKLTGRGPSDPDQRATKMATGWKPYSYVNASGEYISFERMDPFGMFLGISADIAEMGGQMKQEELDEFAVVATAALARNIASKTYLRGITDALGAMTSGDPNKFQRFLNSSAGSFVPSGLQQGAGLMGQGDNTMREVKGVLDAMRAKIPGLSDNLPPRRNYLGEPITFPPGWGPDSISPITLSPTASDPVKQELARLEAGIGMPTEKLAQGRINLRAFTKPSGQDAYDRMLELRQPHKVGRYTLQESLEKLIASDRYKRLPDSTDTYSSEKLKLIQETFGKYQESIERQVREEYPDLKAAMKADDDNKRLMKRPNGGNPIEDILKPLTAP